MIELQGKYTNAKIYADTIEDGVYSQVYDIINCKAFENKKVVCMPDVHVGASGPCGLVAEIGNYVCPEHVGVDIGCSVSAILLDKQLPVEKYAEFEHKVKKAVPMGFTIHDNTIIDEKDFRKFMSSWFSKYKSMQPELLESLPTICDEKYITDVLKRIGMDEAMFWHSIGTCGGGNHFIEYNEGDDCQSVTLHFGSRNFGLKVCNYWTKVAKSSKITKNETKRLTNEFKASYKGDMKEFKKSLSLYIEKATSNHINGYLSGDSMKGYLCDMVFAMGYARYNHMTVQKIISDILLKYGIKVIDRIFTTHNYIDFRDFTLRKSAISANKDEVVLIPFNMRDGLAVCTGLGNKEWLNSCSHGAGRKMSRSAAKKTLDMKEFENTMKGVYSTTVNMSTIDESPMAYKDTDEIVRLIKETVKINYMMKPKINIKAAE